MITGFLAYVVVGLVALPFYWFFEMPNGKSWTVYMDEVLNIQS